MRGTAFFGFFIAAVMFVSGCSDPKEKYGKTWYIDGAGN